MSSIGSSANAPKLQLSQAKATAKSKAQAPESSIAADLCAGLETLRLKIPAASTAPAASPAAPESPVGAGLRVKTERRATDETLKSTLGPPAKGAGARAQASFNDFSNPDFVVTKENTEAALSLLDIAEHSFQGLKVVYGEHPDGSWMFAAAHTAFTDNAAAPDHKGMAASVGVDWKNNGADAATKALGKQVFASTFGTSKAAKFGGLRLIVRRNDAGAISNIEISTSVLGNNGTAETQRRATAYYLNILKAAGVSRQATVTQGKDALSSCQVTIDAIKNR